MTSIETTVKKENQHIYPIFLPKSTEKQQYSILNFRESDNVDFTNISSASIKRENNFRDFKSAYDIDTTPKFGEGSQFGKEQKDEARRKKYGMMARKYNPNDQPWIVSLGTGKEARRFKGTKCKDLLDNASYFAFIPDSDGTFTALPIEEWCDCKYLPKYKTLSIEEAEEEFSRRDKVHNKYAVMLNKRMKDEAEEAAEAKTAGENDGSNDEDSDEEVKKEKEKKKGKGKGKKVKEEDEREDDGDVDEGEELDYITDESSGEEDKKENEEEGDDDDDANESEEDEDENKEEDQANNNNNNKNTDSSDTSSDSDIDNDPHLPILVNKNNQASKRSHGEASGSVPAKKQKLDTPPTPSPLPTPSQPPTTQSPPSRPATTTSTKLPSKPTDSSSLEKQVRRYLQRKPMTSKDLIHKLRKTCGSKEQLMEDIVAVLMRINPTQTKVNDKLYFTLKSAPSNDDEVKNAG